MFDIAFVVAIFCIDIDMVVISIFAAVLRELEVPIDVRRELPHQVLQWKDRGELRWLYIPRAYDLAPPSVYEVLQVQQDDATMCAVSEE